MTQPRRLTVREIDGRRTEIAVEIDDNGAAHVGPDGAFWTTRVDDHVYRVAGHDGATPVVAVVDRETCWVFSNGNTWRVQLETGQAPRGFSHDGQGHGLSAPMPATVVRVLVEAGQSVAQGEIVILLEAMKMELSIRAPRAGRVTAIRCREGDLVQAGLPLLDLE